MPPNFTFRPPYYKGTAVSFTETLADLLFYALQHNYYPLTLEGICANRSPFAPLSVGPRSAHARETR